MATSHKPFHQKYRPNCLGELVGQELVSVTLKQALITQKIAPAYLFSGPRGTGKTSSARILSKSLNCLAHTAPHISPCNCCDLCKSISDGTALDIIEIDAASNTGVENVREIIERSNFAPTQARWKVYVIDECHMLSTAASNALLKTIEEPPASVIFILATTNPEKVLKTIHSRCQKFDFKRINTDDIYKHLLDIANKESITFEESAINLIAKRSNGGMRDAQSLLDQLSLIPDGITKEAVENLLGEVSENKLINIIESLILNSPESLIKNCCQLYDSGNEPISILEGLLNITRDLLLKTNDSNYSDLFYTSKEFQPKLDQIAKSLNKAKIIKWHKNLKNSEYQIKNSNQPRLWLEIHLSSLIEIQSTEKDIQSASNNSKSSEDQKINLNINNLSTHNKDNQTLDGKVNQSITNKSEETFDKSINQYVQDKSNNYQATEIAQANNENDNQSINLKEKWSLILSKLELPSTRMLLSQQAELLNIQSDHIEIGLAPNWENMIKSRKVIIENAVKKTLGEHIKINFSINQKSDHKISSPAKPIKSPPNNFSNTSNISTPQNSNKIETGELIKKDSSQNLADFFNGEVIDSED